MQYKIINPSRFSNDDAKKNALLVFYARYFKIDPAEKLNFSRGYWEAIKKPNWESTDRPKKSLFFTLDTVLMIYNDGLIEEDMVTFLQLLQKNNLLRAAFLEVLQKEELEKDWERLSRDDLTERFFDESEVVALQDLLADERDKARKSFCKVFFGESIGLFHKHCPSLINELNAENLRKLILSHTAAFSLLNDPSLAPRIAAVLQDDDIGFLFASKVESVRRRQYTRSLLTFCRTYKTNVFIEFLKLYQRRIPSETLNQESYDYIEENLLSCEFYFVEWVAQNSRVFFAYYTTPQHFTRLLRFPEDPLKYLANILRSNIPIAEILMDAAIGVVATLLRLKKIPDQTLVDFLKQSIVKDETFASTLAKQIRSHLSEFDTNLPFDAGDIVEILLNPAMRALIKLTPEEIKAYIQQPSLQSLLDRIISEDDVVYTRLEANLVGKVDFPLTTGLRGMKGRLAVYSSVEALENNLTAFEAFALANSNEWDTFKDRLIQSKTPLQTLSHLIFRLRLEYGTHSKSSFSEFLCDQFLSDRYFEEFKRDRSNLEILLFVGTGAQIVNCVAKIFSACRSAAQLSGAASQANMGLNALRRHLLGKLARGFTELNKLLCTVSVTNILELLELFCDNQFLEHLNCKFFFQALMAKSVAERVEILKRNATRGLVLKILTESASHGFDFSLMRLLNDSQDVGFLFKDLSDKDILQWLNSDPFSEAMITFIFTHSSFSVIRPRLITIIQKNWDEIRNRNLLYYVFCNLALLSKVVEKLSLASLVKFLISDLGMKTMECLVLQRIESQQAYLPLIFSSNIVVFDGLAKESNTLIEIICTNVAFGQLVFIDWCHCPMFNFTFEELLYRLLSKECSEALNAYLKLNNFIALLRSVVENLSPELQAKINQYCLAPPRESSNHSRIVREGSKGSLIRNKLVRSDSASNLVLQRQHNNLCEAAKEVSYIHDKIRRGDFGAAVAEMKSEMDRADGKLSPAILVAKFFPGIFLINNHFYEFILLTAQKHPHLASVYLLSLPRDFFKEYKFLVEDPENKISQVAFAKMLYRLESLVSACIVMSLQKQDHKSSLEALFLCGENFPGTVLTFLLKNKVFCRNIVSLLALYWKNERLIKCEGELVVGFLILHAYTYLPVEEVLSEEINFIIGHIAAHIKMLTDKKRAFIVKVLPLADLLKIGHPRLIGLFLRFPEFVQSLTGRDLLLVLKPFPSLITSIIFYPHNLSKFSAQQLSLLLKYLTSWDIHSENEMNIFFEFFQQHLNAVQSHVQDPTTTTGRLFVAMGPSQGFNEDSYSTDEKKLVESLKGNTQFLPFLMDGLAQRIIQSYLLKYNYLCELDVLQILIMILVDSNRSFVSYRISALVKDLVSPEGQVEFSRELNTKIAESRETFGQTSYADEEASLIKSEVARFLGDVRRNSAADLPLEKSAPAP